MIVRFAGLCGESRLRPAVVCACVGAMLSIGAGAIAQDLPAQGVMVSQASTPAPAPEEAAAVESAPVEDQEQLDDRFHVVFTPYIWLPSLSGDLKVKGVEADVDSSFLDIVEDSEFVFGLMGSLEFQYDRIIVQANGAWTYVEAESQSAVSPTDTLKIDSTTQTAWIELLGGYRILDRGLAEINDKRRFTLDAFVGCRLTIIDFDLDATLEGELSTEEGDLDHEEIWAEPFIGLRTGVDITNRIGISLRGDIGGFGAGSDLAWQFIGGIGYTFHMGSWDGAALLGFRALSQDYENGDFKWDVTTYGPILGVQFTF